MHTHRQTDRKTDRQIHAHANAIDKLLGHLIIAEEFEAIKYIISP